MPVNYVVLEELTSEEKLEMAIKIIKERIVDEEELFSLNNSKLEAARQRLIVEDKLVLSVLEEYKSISEI